MKHVDFENIAFASFWRNRRIKDCAANTAPCERLLGRGFISTILLTEV